MGVVTAILLAFAALLSPVDRAAGEEPRHPAAAKLGLRLAEDDTVRVSLHEADLRLVLRALAEVGGFQLVLDSEVSGKVTAEFEGVPIDRALLAVLRTHGLVARLDGRSWSGDDNPSGGEDRRHHPVLSIRSIDER